MGSRFDLISLFDEQVAAGFLPQAELDRVVTFARIADALAGDDLDVLAGEFMRESTRRLTDDPSDPLGVFWGVALIRLQKARAPSRKRDR